jgi:hypothetical protein
MMCMTTFYPRYSMELHLWTLIVILLMLLLATKIARRKLAEMISNQKEMIVVLREIKESLKK